MVLVTSFDQFIHIEKHCTSTAAFQREQALAVRIRKASLFGQFLCQAGTEAPTTRHLHTKNSVIRHRGCRRQRSRGRQGLFSAFSDRYCIHRNSHSSRGFVAHCCSVTNSGITSATRFLLTPFHCAFASRGCDVWASHGLSSKLGPNKL